MPMANDYALGFSTKDLEDLTPNCKLSWPHSAPEDSINIPPFFIVCISYAYYGNHDISTKIFKNSQTS
jgi:hypothetical protein